MPAIRRFAAASALCALAPIAAVATAPASGHAQTAPDSAAIRATALDYIEGWYAGDAERMERALHPQVAKRIVHLDPATGASLVETSALELVQQVPAGGGSRTPADGRRTDVTILDVFEDAASVRVDAGGWIDYLHLARFGDRWLIVNVLWEWRGEGPW
jgi:hypothetical protein